MPTKIKPVVIEPGIFLKANAAKRTKMASALMESPPRHNIFGCIEENDRQFIKHLARANPVAGYYFGAANRLLNLAALNSLREAIPLAVAAATDVAAHYKHEVTPAQIKKLTQRLGRAVPSKAEMNLGHEPFAAFDQLHSIILKGKMLPLGVAFAQVMEQVQALILPDVAPTLPPDTYEPPVGSMPSADDLEKTKPEHGEYTSNEDKKTIDHWPQMPLPGTTSPDDAPEQSDNTPATTITGQEAFWLHWTAIEWPPLAKSEARMAFCLEPAYAPTAISSGGDRPQLIELPGGPILKYPRHGVAPIMGGHVMRQWDLKKYESYWVEMPERADFVRVGVRNHLYTALLQPERGDDIDWEELKKKIEEAIKDKKVKEKIKEQIEKQAGKLLEGVTLFGFGLGKSASSVAELLSSLIMELIDWILEEFFSGKKLQPVVVVHKTVYTGAEPESFVTYHSKDAGGEETLLEPRALKNPHKLPGKLNPYLPLPKVKASHGEPPTSAVHWTGESVLPEKGPLPNMMINTRQYPILWPGSQRYGGHVFVPLFKKQKAHYVVAIRTEVRKGFITFT